MSTTTKPVTSTKTKSIQTTKITAPRTEKPKAVAEQITPKQANPPAPENEFDKFLKTLLTQIDVLSNDIADLETLREKLVPIFEDEEVAAVEEEIGQRKQELSKIRGKYEEKNKFYKEEILTIHARLEQRARILNSSADILKKESNKHLYEFFLLKQKELADLFSELVKKVE